MILPVLKTPEYLSPTSFMEFEKCGMKFYLKRMSGQIYIKDIQSLPAAIGSAFDAIASWEIAKCLGLENDPEMQLQHLINNSVDETLRGEAVPHAQRLFDSYKSMGCFSRLMDAGVTDIHPATKKIVHDNLGNEVSLYGKPDVFLHDGTPVEFKINGATSKTGQSPCQGYKMAYFSNGQIKSHERWKEPLENLNEEWAIQLFIYNMMHSGLLPFRDYKYRLEQGAIRPTNHAFATFQGVISEEFARRTWTKLYNNWKRILAGDIPDANVSKTTCHSYNQLCEVAEICTSYQEIRNSPMGDMILGDAK